MKKIVLKLASIKYAGDFVGDDIRLEIEVSGQLFTVDQNIEPRTTFEFNREITELSGDGTLEIPVRIKIVEQDILFDDKGETSGTLRIDTANLPQTFNFEIKVQERGTNFRKATAYDSFWNKKTKDKVRNPLENGVNLSSWNESYEAAREVLVGQIKDPTFGATHFHSYKHQKDFPRWATKKNFKIKIDKVYFYEPPA